MDPGSLEAERGRNAVRAELERREETGILVTPGDVDAVAVALAALVRDSGLRRRMGEAARGFVLRRYTI